MIKKHMSKGDHHMKPQMRIRKHMDTKSKYKMITIDDEGNENVMEWEGEGEMPHEMREHRIVKKGPGAMKGHSENGNDFMFYGDGPHGPKRLSDAYMGAQIESADNGVSVLDLMKDSPADKAKIEKGDVIQRINGARTRTMEDLLDLLNYFEPGDKLDVQVLRDGKEKKLNMTLGKRPDHYR